MTTITDNVVFKDYVNPHLCVQLEALGFPCTGMYKWIVKGDAISVNSRAFDYDDYYLQAEKIIAEINPADKIINALTIKDVEQHLPDMQFAKLDGKYKVYGLEWVSHEILEDSRLPDLFARYLIILAQKRVVIFRSLNFSND